MAQPKGEGHSLAKLTMPEVNEIRVKYAQGGETYFSLAAQYGVDSGTISCIIRGRSWKHLPHTVAPAPAKPPMTHCIRDHEFTPENTIWKRSRRDRTKMERRCRKCHNAAQRRKYAIQRGYK